RAIDRALVGERGGFNNPFGRSGKPAQEINRDLITVDLIAPSPPPATIPMPGAGVGDEDREPLRTRKRDYKSEPQTGTSVSYALRRLERNRPDLLDQVKTGDLTPNGAMVKAGFKAHSITIPDEPVTAARRLLRHFQGERLRTLIEELARGLAADKR
ncbi:MAG: hypothetical protein KGR26_13005, partial [Cyanobacteria bacterium REEB65]|nr:hypothetical protein [Cyanobacteria bacterium REEB65]